MEYYRHTQLGRDFMLVMSGVFLILLFLAVRTPDSEGQLPLLVSAMAVMAFGTLFFKIVTVVGDDYMEIIFGAGLIRKRIALNDIAAVRETTIPWYNLGIKRISKGWAYNVSGSFGVEIVLHDERRVVVGTDDAAMLKSVLEEITN